jgi:hypothetical protein
MELNTHMKAWIDQNGIIRSKIKSVKIKVTHQELIFTNKIMLYYVKMCVCVSYFDK